MHPKSWVVPLKRKDNRHLLDYIYEFTKEHATLSLPERVYWTLNDLHSHPRCKRAGCDNTIEGAKCWPLAGYRTQYCSIKCSMIDPVNREKIRKDCIARIGYDHPMKAPDKRLKLSQKMKNKTFEEKCHSQALREATCMKKYGVRSVMQLDENKLKMSLSQKNKSIEEKKAILQRIKATRKERYGNENYVNAESAKLTKSKFSAKKKRLILMKRKFTCLKKYGVESAFKDIEVKKKSKITRCTKTRTRDYAARVACDEHVEPMFSLEHYIQFARSPLKWKCKHCGREFMQKIGEHQMRDCRIARCLDCFPLNTNESYAEIEMIDFIKSIYDGEVTRRCRKIIAPREIDIWVPGKKTGIEFDGLYWHSQQLGTPDDYHISKTEECEARGVHLLHIFENEWKQHRKWTEGLISSFILEKKEAQLNVTREDITPMHFILKMTADENEDAGSIDIQKLKHGGHFAWQAKIMEMCNGYSVHCLLDALASFWKEERHLQDESLYLNLDRRHFKKEETVSQFKLIDVTKPTRLYFEKLADRVDMHIYAQAQYQKLVKMNPTGDYLRIFDCGKLVYKLD